MHAPFPLFFSLFLLLAGAGCSQRISDQENLGQQKDVSLQPKIFYEQKTIAGFEPGGTPFGPSVLYRKDGVKGQPQKVLSLDSGSAFPSVTSNFSVGDGYLVQRERGSDSLTATKYTVSGNKVHEITEPVHIGFTPRNLISHDGSTQATTTMYCPQVVLEGPCGFTFRLDVTSSLAGVSKTLEQKDFPGVEGGNFFAEPVAFTADNKQLIVYVTQVGDYINPASLYAMNVSDYSVTQLLKANYPNPKDPKNIDRLTSIRTSSDGTAIWAERDFGEQVATGELLKITLSPWDVQKVADITPLIESHELKPDDTGVILQSPNGGFSYLDFSTRKTHRLTEQGNFLGWSHDGKYYLYRVYDDVYNGLGPYRLMVGSMVTGAQTEIVRQTVTAQSMKTTTKVGDILYAPVGIW